MIKRLVNAKQRLTERLRIKKSGRTGRQKEVYSVIIASETDARKKTLGFYVTRKTVISLAAAAALVIAVFAVMTVVSLFQALHYSARTNELKSDILIQSSLAETYAGEIESLSSKLNELKQSMLSPGTIE
jgi:cell division protein FtsL